MAPAGGGDETGEGGEGGDTGEARGTPMRRGVYRSAAGGVAAGPNLGTESGSRKRQAAVMSKDSISLVGNEAHLKVACKDSQRILKEIEDLRAQLDEDVKELGYCEANEKLRVELALKVKEMQRLRVQNEEKQGNNDGMRKQNEELQAQCDGMVKQNKELQAMNDGLVKENEELRTKIDSMSKWNGELQAKNGSVTMWNEDLQAKNDSLSKKKEELQAKIDSLRKENEELQAKNVGLVKQNEEVQANNGSMRKQNGELQAKNGGLTKRNEELQAKNDSLTEWIEELEDKNDALEDLSGSLARDDRQSSDELQQARKDSTMGLKDELNGQTAIGIKRMGELDEKPFQNACKRKYGNADYQARAAELVLSWQDELKKPSWHPFVVAQVNGEHKEVLDDDDAKLKLLRSEYGDDVCNAVKTALMEINVYSPSERDVVPEFWNFRKGRKATMKEVLYLFGHMEMTTEHRRC